MTETGTGLVLRTYPLTETSLIVRWLTAAFGRISTVAKGARRPQSPFHGKLDLFYLADFSFNRSRRSELHTLREVSLRDTHTSLRRELGYLQQASYCAGLIEMATEAETPLPELFELFRRMLQSMLLQPPQPGTIFAFELKLLAELGLEPSAEPTGLSAAGMRAVTDLRQAEWPEVAALAFSQETVGELRRFLHGFIIYHLGHLPRGREAALA